MAVGLEVVLVHHRTPDRLRETLLRLALHAPASPVTVVDTAPDAATWQRLADAHPRLRWLAVANHSYAFAANAGLKATGAPLVAIMNADVLIGPRTFGDLAAAFADPSVALAGPLARTPNGRLQDQGLLYRRHHLRLRRRAAARAVLEDAPPAWVPVPWLSGCLLVVRRSAVQRVGGMDPRLRFYNEDLEWGHRVRAAGMCCALVASEVVHLGGDATPSDVRFLIEGLRGGLQLTRRHAPPWLRWAHRQGLGAVAVAAGAWARDHAARARWREVRRRWAAGAFDDSPFGTTLDDPSPDPDSGPGPGPDSGPDPDPDDIDTAR